jgi:sporulation protein YlmC with PRC-barrel domain
MFTTIPTTEDLSSNLIGLDIYNNTKDKIGTVKDIAMTAGRVNAYIVGVGGFLGMGDHYVAVTPSAITINYDPTDKKWHATMNTDAAALKAAPEYKYAS